MYNSCRTCQFYKQWDCFCPRLVKKFNGPMPAITMRGYEEHCGEAGKYWEKRRGIISAILTWAAKKAGWLE